MTTDEPITRVTGETDERIDRVSRALGANTIEAIRSPRYMAMDRATQARESSSGWARRSQRT